MALIPYAALCRRPAMEAATALPVNRGFVARQSRQDGVSAAASGELIVEKAAQQADAGERQDAGEDAEEGEDGEGIGDRQDEGREIGAKQVLRVLLELLRAHDAFAQRADADIDEEEAARHAQPSLIAEQEIRNHGQAKAGDDAKDRVGTRRAEAGEEAEETPLEDGAANAHHADRTARNAPH